MNKNLTYKLKLVTEISEDELKRMFTVMSANYDYITIEAFKKDLSNKDYAGILLDDNLNIQGFTTFAINPKNYQHPEYNILFSGDTVISSDYVGSQELGKGWCKTVGSILAKFPEKKWMWYLMSKGYKTYLYLPFFFNKYYPAAKESEHENHQSIAHQCSTHFFGNEWNKKKGIVQFTNKIGQVKKEHAQKSFKKSNLYVDYFLERNPGFVNGDELVCIAELAIDNFKRFPKLLISRTINSNSTFDIHSNEL